MEWKLCIGRFNLVVSILQLLDTFQVLLNLCVNVLHWNNSILIKDGLLLHGPIIIIGLILSLCSIFNYVFELRLLLIDCLKSMEWQLLSSHGWFLLGIAF
jgi:hypothetical protein